MKKGGKKKAAAARFKTFHGKEPREEYTVTLGDMTHLTFLGKAVAIEYEAAKHSDKQVETYRHKFGKGAEVLTNGKELIVTGGKIRITARGIEG